MGFEGKFDFVEQTTNLTRCCQVLFYRMELCQMCMQEEITMEEQLDFIRQEKGLYQPKTTPAIIDVPEMTFLAVDGHGNPNEPDGEYGKAVGLLYALSYTIKMSDKGKTPLPGLFRFALRRWRDSGRWRAAFPAWTTATRMRLSGRA